MFGFSLFLLAAMAFLVVVTAAVVLVARRGKSAEGLGCCAGCGFVLALLLAGLIGAGAVLLLAHGERAQRHGARHELRRHERAIERHEQAAERLERALERRVEQLERRLERMRER
jgi:biopolymer transport protein ExbB/TolQ